MMFYPGLGPLDGGGPPPAHKFDVSAWTDAAGKAMLAVDKITNTKYGKLQLMAKNIVDYIMFGGPQNFGKWMDVHSAPSCHTEARAPVEHLVGQFASGMTSLLGKLVEGWTTINVSDSDTVARQFTSFVKEQTHQPTGCRGRYDYNSSPELPDMQDDLDGDAGLDKDDDDDMENVQHATDDDEHGEVRAGGTKGKAAVDVPPVEEAVEQTGAGDTGVSPSKGGRVPEDVGQGSVGKRSRTDPVATRRSKATAGGQAVKKKQAPTPTRACARLNKGAPTVGDTTSTRSSPRMSTSNTGDHVVLEDLRKTIKKVKKTTTRVTKKNRRDPLERIHSKLSTGGNSDVHETPVKKTVGECSNFKIFLRTRKIMVMHSNERLECCPQADTDPTTHAEFFINNLKETWTRHYGNSRVQINHFPIEYVATTKQGNRHDYRFHTLEYLAKWEGQRVLVITAAMVVELRKIYTWNWLMNEDFNKRDNAREFIEEAVKKANKNTSDHVVLHTAHLPYIL
ncbi:uncharacterized protein [Triticum aestivum]|uniref:uncharacterized protein n=1 Tax=Triticum aestivum TaxID=4565 RepID=UPI001D01B24D|nr:uncharacterized protein LOC123039168 [Triticum aestivum]